MAKKKASQPRPAVSDRVAFQVRLKNEVHAKIAAEAKAAGVSLNQLIESLLEGCAASIVRGRPVTHNGVIAKDEVPGHLFIGRTGLRFVRVAANEDEADSGMFPDPGDLHDHELPTSDRAKAGRIKSRGCVAFELNFSASPVRIPDR